VIGGVLVDSGRFDWDAATARSGRFTELTAPYEGFHDMVFSEESTSAPSCCAPAAKACATSARA
jgi:O-acetylhomoserine (thiol)-lyase